MPQLQRQQSPEMSRVIAAATAMFVQGFLNDLLIEVAPLLRSGFRQRVVEQVAEFVVEPPLDRYAEPLLRAMNDLVGNQTANSRLQDVLSYRTAELQRGRYGLHKLDEFVIE